MRYTEGAILEEGVLCSWEDKPEPGAAGGPILAKGGPGHTATGQTAAQKAASGRTARSRLPEQGRSHQTRDRSTGKNEVQDLRQAPKKHTLRGQGVEAIG